MRPSFCEDHAAGRGLGGLLLEAEANVRIDKGQGRHKLVGPETNAAAGTFETKRMAPMMQHPRRLRAGKLCAAEAETFGHKRAKTMYPCVRPWDLALTC